MVRERLPDHPMDSADILFDPDVVSKLADCGVSLLDGPTTLFPMVLAYLGRDPTMVDNKSVAAAEAQLKLVKPYIRYFSNTKDDFRPSQSGSLRGHELVRRLRAGGDTRRGGGA